MSNPFGSSKEKIEQSKNSFEIPRSSIEATPQIKPLHSSSLLGAYDEQRKFSVVDGLG